MTEAEKAVRAVVDAYKAAVWAKDVDALVALYDPEVCVFDLWGSWSYRGAAAWRGMVAAWLSSLGSERAVVDLEDVQALVTQQLAVVHALVIYTGVSAAGTPLRVMHNRLTWALKQDADGWKIIHEHTSAPVDAETSKVILQR